MKIGQGSKNKGMEGPMNGLRNRIADRGHRGHTNLAWVLAASIAFSILSALPAGAVSVKSTPCAGQVSWGTANGYAEMMRFNVGGPAVNAGRSSCNTGTQLIYATRRLWVTWDGGRTWSLGESRAIGFTVLPGQYAQFRFPTVYFPRGISWGPGVSVDVNVEWKTSNGTSLGTSYLNYNSKSDYFCATVSGGINGACLLDTNPTMGAYMYTF